MVPGGENLVGHLCVASLLAGFTEVDKLYGSSAEKTLVQGPHTHDSGVFAPVAVLFEGVDELDLLDAGDGTGDVFLGGVLETEPVVVGHELEDLEVAGGGYQGAVERIGHAA